MRKSLSITYKLVFILFLLIIIFVIVVLNINYYSTINTKGVINVLDNNYYVLINICEDDVSYVINNSYFKIDKKDIFYKIYKIDDDMYNSNYKIIYLKAKLDKEYKINNLNLDIKIFKENKKIINYIIDYLKER